MSLMKKMLVGIAVAFAVSYAFARLAPSPMGMSLYAVACVMPVVLLLAIVFLRALKRQEDLSEWIAIELNKIRRVYHLGKNLGTDGKLREWFTELHGYLYGYLTAFDKKDFSQYQETNGEFRKMSYHLYTLPELASEKERVLYRELLEAAGTVAGARQRIQELWNGGLSPQLWNALLILAALAYVAVLTTVNAGDWLIAALLLSVLTGAVKTVKSVDHMKTLSSQAMAKRYVENIARLELRRHE